MHCLITKSGACNTCDMYEFAIVIGASDQLGLLMNVYERFLRGGVEKDINVSPVDEVFIIISSVLFQFIQTVDLPL